MDYGQDLPPARPVVANGLGQNVLVAGDGDAGDGPADPRPRLGPHAVAGADRAARWRAGCGWWRRICAAWARPTSPRRSGRLPTMSPISPRWSISWRRRPFALVGFSLGGMVAAAFADRPSRTCLRPPDGRRQRSIRPRPVAPAPRRCWPAPPTLGPRAFAAEQAAAICRPEWAAAHPGEVARFIDWRAAMDQAGLWRAFRSELRHRPPRWPGGRRRCRRGLSPPIAIPSFPWRRFAPPPR